MPNTSKPLLLQRKDCKGTINILSHVDWNWSHILISFKGPRGAVAWEKVVYLPAVPNFLESLKPLITMPEAAKKAMYYLTYGECHTVANRTAMLAMNAEELYAAVAMIADGFDPHPAVVAPAEGGDADASPTSV